MCIKTVHETGQIDPSNFIWFTNQTTEFYIVLKLFLRLQYGPFFSKTKHPPPMNYGYSNFSIQRARVHNTRKFKSNWPVNLSYAFRVYVFRTNLDFQNRNLDLIPPHKEFRFKI